MKKRALKSLSVVCALALIISLCPCFNVSAATAVSTLSADLLAGTQAPTAITTNLTLPEIDGTWSSSNEAVINSTTGAVTRPLAEDVKVTLTATPTEGEPVSFNFTVKAKNKNVIAQENFNFTGLENAAGTENIYDTIKNDWAISSTANKGSKIATDSTGNKYLEADMSVGNTVLYWKKAVEDDAIYLNFDAMRASAGNTVALQAYVTGEDAAGNAVTRLLRLALFYDGKIYWGNNANRTGSTAVDTGVLKPVAFKIDLANKKVYGSYNNGAWTEVDSTNTSYGTTTNISEGLLATDTITGLSYLRFLAHSSGAANIMLDNFVLSTDAELTASQTLSLVSADSLAGNQAPTAITTNLTMPEHTDITWSSSNENVISNAGVVTRPLAKDAKVTMTATPNDGSGDPVTFNFTVKAKNKNVIAWDNFNYTGLDSVQGTTSFYPTMGNGWRISAAAPNSKIMTDSNGNQYLEADMSAASTQLFWDKTAQADIIYLDFDAMRVNEGNTVSLQAYVTGKNAAGEDVTRLLRLAVFYDGKIHWGNIGYGIGTTAVDTAVLKPVAFKIDLANKKIYGSYNNGAWTEVDSTDTTYGTTGSGDNRLLATDTITGLSSLRFLAQSSGAANIMLDNFVITTESFPILNAQCNSSGTVSAVIGNSGAESIAATVICAGYQGDKLTAVESKPITLQLGNNSVAFTQNFSDATTYSIYLWNSLDKLIPLSTSVSGAVKEE